jgi:hypothetical protein
LVHSITIQDVVRKQIETTKYVYLKSPERMFSEYKGEKENVKNYNGRQLLEMLQNADDAASEAKGERKVLIKLSGSTLFIANTGYSFSEEGLNSIFHSHLSPKEAIENQIGNKGLGFRSILSWANIVTIKSQDLCVAFSQEYSKKVLDELLQNEEFNIKFQKLNKGHKTPISTLVCPNADCAEIIQFVGADEYDTIIQIDLHEKAIEEVKKQIQHDLDGEVLLFLNNLQKIEIDINGLQSGYTKIIYSPTIIQIESYSSLESSSKVWNINTLSGRFEDIDRPYQLSLAWQDDFEDNKDVIYAYFRTKVPVKCNGILHGSFELNADRNLIIVDEEGYNHKLVSLLPYLISQTAEKIAENESEQVNYKPVSFLDFNFRSLSHLVETSFLKNELTTLIKSRKIFPTITNIYIDWNEDDKPVYYSEMEFATYLSPDDFPDLLLYCDNEDIEEFIQDLNPTTYNIESIIDDFAKKKDFLTIEEYSKIICAIYNYIDEKTDFNDRKLFYDNYKNDLYLNKPIFLPNIGNQYNLPPELGVQIIHTELAAELLKITGCENFGRLSSRLHKFKIKEYKFSEVVEILIQHYSSSFDKTEDPIELIKHLFNIFSKEEIPGKNWLGTPVTLIDKKGEKQLATELYFGKEYKNSLIEEIYSYNKGKILASPKKLKAEEINENDWKNFLEWLGVKYFPRKISTEGETEYGENVMKSFNFKHQIGDYYFKGGFNEFKEKLSGNGGYVKINVTSIDDIDNILKHNGSEKILQLIEQDEYIIKNLKKNTEPGSSEIIFKFYKDKNHRSIDGNLMKSYIKWKIENNPWLLTESGEKACPSKCATAAYINEDFQGLVEKPKINYDVLKKNNINKEEADNLLTLIGVHKTINTFPTSMLYSILLQLPKIDPEGKKSKTIYTKLAANYDDKLLNQQSKRDPNYIEFHHNGEVFCENGVYVPIKEAFYVNDKRYGDTIIKLFNTIVIDKRKGKEKIKKIFGVEALDKIELILDGNPIPHTLNSLFENEIEKFKPYVYLLRKEVDDGSEKNIIKDTKFGLVTGLKLKLLMDDKAQSINLNDYEYYYLKKRNIVYIKVPENHIEIQDLKEDVKVCSVISEAFSAILDVESQRKEIRELFSKTSNDRDELLRIELEDNNLQKLNEARKILGVTNNPKLEFWKSFSKCLKGNKIKFKIESDSELLEQLEFNFHNFKEIILQVFDEINYQEINEETSSELIVKLFKTTGVKINQFNQFHYPSIDIKEHYEINFKRAKDKNKNTFKSLYYEKCLANNELKDDFTGVLNSYDFIPPNVKNEVDFDVEKDLAEQLKLTYDVDIFKVIQQINIDQFYQNNLESLFLSTEQINNKRELLEQFINEDNLSQSLLYFEDKLTIIEERLNLWLGKSQDDKTIPNSSTKPKRISFGSKTFHFDNFSDLKNEVDKFLEAAGQNKVTLSNLKTTRTETESTDNNRSPGNTNTSVKTKVQKEEIGFLGENEVYKYLLKTVENKESVKWVSGYARKLGINLDGKDGLGYDFVYIPNGAIHPRYVEVKVVGWENAFYITPTEVKYGEKYKKHYEIFLVRNLETLNNIKIEKIQGLFDYKGKSFTNNDSFTVINESFKIKFKEAKEKL